MVASGPDRLPRQHDQLLAEEQRARAGQGGEMGTTLIAVVAEGDRGRVYLPPGDSNLEDSTEPAWRPSGSVPERLTGGTCYGYGLTEWGHLFTDRQLVALNTFSDLVAEVRDVVERDALDAGRTDDGHRFRDGGSGAAAYADAVLTYLAFGVDKCADYWSTICTWHNSKELIRNTFARQAIPMTWDFAEANPFSQSTGNWSGMVDWMAKVVEQLPATQPGVVAQRDAGAWIAENSGTVLSTDPPYYDNISYADLSDFFYVWLRRNLSSVWPDEFSTLLTPKVEELIANPYRQGSREAAFHHFESGMEAVFEKVARHHDDRFPLTVFYAFKQAEIVAEGQVSTGWETFLDGLLASGLGIHATWPVRTELANRPLASGTAALASSIVLVCRPRQIDAAMATRSEFLNALRAELPEAVRLLQAESILPVDLAQSAIGPGIAVFSRFSKVVEADGSSMSVRQALALINEVLQEVLSEEETEFDADTRWALTWYEENGFSAGEYGRAETLSKAKDTSITGVVSAGVATSRDGKVKLVGRDERPVPDAGGRDEEQALAVEREAGDVELPHQRRLIDERVVIGRREHRRVGRLVKSAGNSPAARHIEPHHAGPRSMTLGQKEELRAGEERVVRRDARLVRGKNDRPIIEVDSDARDPSRVNSPGLLTD